MKGKPGSPQKPRKKRSPSNKNTFRMTEELLPHVGVGIYIAQKGVFVYANPVFLNLGGYSKAEIIGHHTLEYVRPEDKEIVRTRAIQSLKGENRESYEYRFTRKNGEVMEVWEVATSIVYQGTRATIGSVMDITERKRMEHAIRQSEERYRTIIENIEDGYYEVDLSGNFTFVNDAVSRHIGYSRGELIGMNNRQYTDEKNAKRVFEAFREIYRTGEAGRIFDYELIRKDGPKIQVEVSASLVKDSSGQAMGFRGISRDVTERKRMENTLRRSEEKYRTILENIEEGYYEEDLSGNFTFVNDSMCRIYGYSREEMMGLNYKRYTDEETAHELFRVFNAIYRTGEPSKGFTFELIRKDGRRRYIETSASLISDSSNKPIGFRGIVRDATERIRMEEALRQSEERYRSIIEQMEDGYFETDLAGNFTFVNDAECRNLGYSREELIGMNNRQYTDAETAKKMFGVFSEIYGTGKPAKIFDHAVIRKDGTLSYDELSASLIRDSKGKPIGFRGVSRDVSERKRAEERMQHLATHDGLTGLPNRMMFSQLLNHAIQTARRYQRQFAILFVDLDRFKVINDTLGHEAGDRVLQEIAERLKQTLRASDIIARFGGDEFAILVEEVSELNQISVVASRILSAILQPMVLMGEEYRITSSIGISMFPGDGEDEKSLLKNADIAMYFAKEEGKNNYQFYSREIKRQSIERLSIETNLRTALERNELSLHYQAKLDFKTNSITGVEALLRWQNPTLGMISPVHFIPVAEETGLIVPIGRWVLRTACAQSVAWQRQGLPPVCMAVNLSVRQLRDESLIGDIRAALNDSGLAPNLLELEITETMVMHNPGRMIAVLAKIKEMGVRLAIDDFGTGYSSLGQIKDFPIDTLKVDRSLIRNIPKDPQDNAITEAILAMGKTLNLTIVAEGVETQEQMDFLRERSCDEMQGYYFSKPITADQFADLLRSHVPSPQRCPSPLLPPP